MYLRTHWVLISAFFSKKFNNITKMKFAKFGKENLTVLYSNLKMKLHYLRKFVDLIRYHDMTEMVVILAHITGKSKCVHIHCVLMCTVIFKSFLIKLVALVFLSCPQS